MVFGRFGCECVYFQCSNEFEMSFKFHDLSIPFFDFIFFFILNDDNKNNKNNNSDDNVIFK